MRYASQIDSITAIDTAEVEQFEKFVKQADRISVQAI
jgi:hypothetical protein